MTEQEFTKLSQPEVAKWFRQRAAMFSEIAGDLEKMFPMKIETPIPMTETTVPIASVTQSIPGSPTTNAVFALSREHNQAIEFIRRYAELDAEVKAAFQEPGEQFFSDDCARAHCRKYFDDAAIKALRHLNADAAALPK